MKTETSRYSCTHITIAFSPAACRNVWYKSNGINHIFDEIVTFCKLFSKCNVWYASHTLSHSCATLVAVGYLVGTDNRHTSFCRSNALSTMDRVILLCDKRISLPQHNHTESLRLLFRSYILQKSIWSVPQTPLFTNKKNMIMYTVITLINELKSAKKSRHFAPRCDLQISLYIQTHWMFT